MVPKQIKLATTETLSISWDDNHQSVISLKTLRDNCPCAGCQGETVLLKTFLPVIQPEMPGKYSLTGAEPVGSYAIAMHWGDGHRTGIHTYQRLRDLCECAECLTKKGAPDPRQSV